MIAKLENLGVKKSVVGLVIPTGYSFNLDGTSIYLTMAAVFIAQATNTPLTLVQELTLLGVLLLTSKGAAGVTGSGFIVLAATLSAVGHVPVAGLALILGVDRFMSEARALTNLIGNGSPRWSSAACGSGPGTDASHLDPVAGRGEAQPGCAAGRGGANMEKKLLQRWVSISGARHWGPRLPLSDRRGRDRAAARRFARRRTGKNRRRGPGPPVRNGVPPPRGRLRASSARSARAEDGAGQAGFDRGRQILRKGTAKCGR
jgi:hypothetical protein